MLGCRTLAHASCSRKRRKAADAGDWAELLGRRAKVGCEERMRGGAGWGVFGPQASLHRWAVVAGPCLTGLGYELGRPVGPLFLFFCFLLCGIS